MRSSIASGPRVSKRTSKPVLLLTTCAMVLPQAAFAQTCEDVASGDGIRSLVVTAQDDVFGHAGFSLERTLGRDHRDRGCGGAAPAQQIAMMQSIVRSFNRSEFENPDSGPARAGGASGRKQTSIQSSCSPRKPRRACIRSACLTASTWSMPRSRPATSATVSSTRSATAIHFNHRMTLIFEAEVPNPARHEKLPAEGLPADGADAGRTWRAVSEGSYRAGTSPGDLGLHRPRPQRRPAPPQRDPVVRADNYILGRPVRANMFVVDLPGGAGKQWQLRQWVDQAQHRYIAEPLRWRPSRTILRSSSTPTSAIP